MVTMSAIWDRTAEVLRGRGGMLAGIAAAMVFLPAVIQNGFGAFAGRSPGMMALGTIVGLVAAAVSIWGNLALVAAASDPAMDRPAALAIAGRRVPLAIGLSLLIVAAFVLLALPPVLIAGASMVDVASLSSGTPRMAANPPHGAVVAVLAYLMVLAVAGVWLTARLALFAPVLVNERLGLRSLARSFELTRDLSWRIIGVLVLFGIVLFVAAGATRAVVGIAALLLLGADRVAAAGFVAAAASAAVVAGATVVSSTFFAQLYRVTSGREAARAFT